LHGLELQRTSAGHADISFLALKLVLANGIEEVCFSIAFRPVSFTISWIDWSSATGKMVEKPNWYRRVMARDA
jgi:hypothetical protein